MDIVGCSRFHGRTQRVYELPPGYEQFRVNLTPCGAYCICSLQL